MRILSVRGQNRSSIGIHSAYSRPVPVVKGWIGARPDVSRNSSRNRSTCGHSVVGRRGTPVVAAQSSSASEGADVENLVIIGSGPAGYTAAIYASRASLSPLVFEGYQAGGVRGGQLMTTTEVENFPGFPEGITGPDLMDRMRQQAERWGSNLLLEDVESVDLSVRPFVIKGTETTVKAHSLIIATGATAKRLNIPSEETFWSRGISACAICDGASPIFKDQELAVVGGGDTATEEAVYLTKYGKHVHLLVRGPTMRASKAMQERVLENPKITVHFNTGVEDAYADKKGAMGGLHLLNNETGEKKDLPVRGLFYGIGHNPNSAFLDGQVELDEAGYVKVKNGGPWTNVEGVFSAGDLHDVEWRQAITAAGSGCMAALAAERYLTGNNLVVEKEKSEERVSESEQQKKKDSEEKEGKDKMSMEEEFNLYADKHRGQYALRKLYHESDRLVTVLYTSPTCGPCRSLKPILNKVVDEYSGQIHLVEIDIAEDPEIAQAAGVNGTPTVQMFKNKDRVANLPGVKMKNEYRKLIEGNL
eukprot:jgi/Picre1/28441/NNA_003845.t1